MNTPKEIFVETKAVQRSREAINFAMTMDYPARITGAPGLGKSTALRRLVREFDGSYLEIGATQKDIVGMFSGLSELIGCWPYGNSTRDLLKALTAGFQGRFSYNAKGKDLLIIDEFQTLEDTAKRELLRLHEVCGFALVLSGNSERLESSPRKPTGAIRQVEDRIGMNIELPPLDDEDCELIARAYGVSDADALAAARALGTRQNARTLARTLKAARILVKGEAPIRLPDIKNALLALNGRTSALGLVTN